MTIQDWGALGELVGGAAVVVSLIYLAIQVRQSARLTAANTAALRGAARDAAQGAMSSFRTTAVDAELSQILLKGSTDPDRLTDHERFRFSLLLEELFYGHESLFVHRRESGATIVTVEQTLASVHTLLGMPGIRQWWKARRSHFREDFAAEVDRQLSD